MWLFAGIVSGECDAAVHLCLVYLFMWVYVNGCLQVVGACENVGQLLCVGIFMY